MLEFLRRWLLIPDLLTGILVTLVAAFLGWASQRLWSAYRSHRNNRVEVKRLHDADDDFDSFYELCAENISREELEPKSELARYLLEGEEHRRNERDSPVPWSDYFGLAKRRGASVGVIYATLYPDKRVGFVNYLGTHTSRQNAFRINSIPLLRALHQHMKRIGCDGLLYETDCRGPDLSREENDYRRNKGQRFIQLARQFGSPTYEIPVDFVQPELSILEDQDYKEVPLVLMYVPLGDPKERITKERVKELLQVTLLNWYLDIYDRPGELRERYEKRLTELLTSLIDALPKRIDLKPLGADWLPPLRDGAAIPSGLVGLSPARRRRRAKTQSGNHGLGNMGTTIPQGC
jgi:hypothetical protein